MARARRLKNVVQTVSDRAMFRARPSAIMSTITQRGSDEFETVVRVMTRFSAHGATIWQTHG